MEANAEWAACFPLGEMRRRGLLPEETGPAASVPYPSTAVRRGTVEASQARFTELLAGSCRHSPSFKSADGALLVWLRLGQQAAESLEMVEYERKTLVDALQSARTLTGLPSLISCRGCNSCVPRQGGLRCRGATEGRCAQRRVALAHPQTCPDPADAATSDRRLFQVHVLPRSGSPASPQPPHGVPGRAARADNGKRGGRARCVRLAGSFLTPRAALRAFFKRGDFRAAAVVTFADTVGVSPGIVVI